MDNDIRLLLGLTDPNITFDPKEQQHYTIANDNGTKLVTHKGPRSAFRFHNFKIRKQKFKCQKCGHTAMARLSDIQPNNHIIDKVKQVIAMELSENVSQKHIALDNNVSTHTVMRAAEGLFVYNKTNFHYLPQNIAFDDFKSGRFALMLDLRTDFSLPCKLIAEEHFLYDSIFTRI